MASVAEEQPRAASQAPAYADQNERDYATLQAAVEDGRLEVEREAD